MRRTALITGASRGIGAAIARRLDADGWQVVNLDREPPGDAVPGDWIEADLTDTPALDAVLARVADERAIDALVNNAAIGQSATLEDTTDEEFDRTIAVNLRAPMICARALLPRMRARGFGRVVNLSSRAHLGKTHRTAYSASKGGILSMTRVWALEFATDGVTVNAIAPGPIRTELFERVNPPGMPRTQAIVEQIPVGRLGEPDDVANAAAFFVDERAGFVTGQVLYVCGGITLARAGN